MIRPIKIAVTGKYGQVARALLSGQYDVTVVPLFRPQFDLANLATIAPALMSCAPDVVVSSAAFTAVDAAQEQRDMAFAVNALGIEELAKASSKLGVPLIHLSTDYVFDGKKMSPYVETDETNPLGVYGASKRDGERAIARLHSNHAILRTAWIYSPFGSNFLKTMLRLGETKTVLNVVDDQIGNPTSAYDIADAIVKVANNLMHKPAQKDMRGIFHLAGSGTASWADFAVEIFNVSARYSASVPIVNRIPTDQYPTPVQRPANSRLNCAKLKAIHRVELPDWRVSTERVIATLANMR